jgi:deoxyguanosine kinase
MVSPSCGALKTAGRVCRRKIASLLLGRRSGLPGRLSCRYTRPVLECRYLALEGPAGVGKGTLAERLASRLDAALVLDETDTNPFLTDEGDRAGSAFQAQLFALLARHRQQVALRQADLFSQTTVSDYLFDKDKIYAYQTLDDNELFIYQRLFELLSRDVPPPDLVVYLQAPTDVLRKRLKERERRDPSPRNRIFPRLPELNEAFNHFFFHYTATPLLVVETSQIDLSWPDAALDDLLRQIQGMNRGTRYYVPRA